MLVTRKKHLVKSGRSRGPNAVSQPTSASSKGTKDRNGMWDKGLTPPCPDVTFQFKSGSVQGAGANGLATDTSREVGESSTQTRYVAPSKGTMGIPHNPLNSECVSQTNQMAENKSLKASSSRSSKDKKNPKFKGFKSLKCSNPETDSSLQFSFYEATSNKKYGSSSSPFSASKQWRVGLSGTETE